MVRIVGATKSESLRGAERRNNAVAFSSFFIDVVVVVVVVQQCAQFNVPSYSTVLWYEQSLFFSLTLAALSFDARYPSSCVETSRPCCFEVYVCVFLPCIRISYHFSLIIIISSLIFDLHSSLLMVRVRTRTSTRTYPYSYEYEV